MFARLSYLVTLSLVVFLAALPLRWALAYGRFLGWICHSVIGLRREVVLRNLRHVMGEKRTEEEIRAIAKASYGQFAMTLVEVLRSAAPFGRGLE